MERVEVPKSMLGRGDTFALRVKGESMRDEGILPGDVAVVQKQTTARNGQTVIALVMATRPSKPMTARMESSNCILPKML
jgi:SOS-response transcriptional repressor LexA